MVLNITDILSCCCCSYDDIFMCYTQTLPMSLGKKKIKINITKKKINYAHAIFRLSRILLLIIRDLTAIRVPVHSVLYKYLRPFKDLKCAFCSQEKNNFIN